MNAYKKRDISRVAETEKPARNSDVFGYTFDMPVYFA